MTDPDTDNNSKSDTSGTDGITMSERINAKYGKNRADKWATDEPLFVEMAADGFDPFEAFVEDELKEPGRAANYTRTHRAAWDDWTAFMATEDRRPECPNQKHVRRFIDHLLSEGGRDGAGLAASTVKLKLACLNRVFRYFRQQGWLSTDADPIGTARAKYPWDDAPKPGAKKPYNLSVKQIRAGVQRVTNVRDRAIMVLQFKTGMRAGEVANAELQDVHIAHADLAAHYPTLGTNPKLTYKDGLPAENAIYVPSRYERKGNKSVNGRIIPLDDETRRVLVAWLLIRPMDPARGEGRLFLSKSSGEPIREQDALNRIYEVAFPPDEYPETDEQKAVTSHIGRHAFTTHLERSGGMGRMDVDYLRGDVLGGDESRTREKWTYIHVSYDDVEQAYRTHIYRLGV